MNNEFTLTDAPDAPSVRRAARRSLSPKQETIVNQIEIMGSITLSAAVHLIGRDIYYNSDKHVGALLSNMVKRGLIVRIRPGVFGRVKK